MQEKGSTRRKAKNGQVKSWGFKLNSKRKKEVRVREKDLKRKGRGSYPRREEKGEMTKEGGKRRGNEINTGFETMP